MAWFQRLLNRFVAKPGRERIWISPQQAGVNVTHDTAMTYSAVAACVRIIAETMAALPWHVYQKAPVGREPLPKHGVQWLLNIQANPEMSAYTFKRTIITHLLTWGNGYAEVERGLDGRAVWLWPLPPDQVCLERDETGTLFYRVRSEDGKGTLLSYQNVLNFPDNSFDGLVGTSRLALARRSIGAGMAHDIFAAAFYENGAHVGGVIENTGKQLSPEATDLLLSEFNSKYSGPDRAAKTMYLDAGMSFKPVNIPLADAQFLESRRFQVEEIARWFGVPMHLLNDLTNANYAISYEASKNFIEHTIRPIAVLMESQANIRLFAPRAQGDIFSRINLNGLMRADPRARGEYYRAMINAGVMSINEVRELEEMNSIGPDGDEHYLQVNMAPISMIGKVAEQALNADDPAPPAAPETSNDDAPNVRALRKKR